MKKISILLLIIAALFFFYGLPGLISGNDPLTGVKYDEMAGMIPMISLLISIIFLSVAALFYFLAKRSQRKR